jgi:hypothetical protein
VPCDSAQAIMTEAFWGELSDLWKRHVICSPASEVLSPLASLSWKKRRKGGLVPIESGHNLQNRLSVHHLSVSFLDEISPQENLLLSGLSFVDIMEIPRSKISRSLWILNRETYWSLLSYAFVRLDRLFARDSTTQLSSTSIS